MDVIKVDDNTIEVTKTETNIKTAKYSYGDLIKQKENIEVQKAREITQRDKEIAEVDILIAECGKLGIGA